MEKIKADKFEKLKERANPVQKVRLECRANRDTALAWGAFPLTKEFRLSDQDVRFMVAYATGAEFPDTPKQCSCRIKLTLEHMVTCGGTKLARHNQVQGRLVGFAREHGIATRQNPRLALEDAKNNQEPDVIFYSGAAPPQETDITVINPCSASYLSKAIQDSTWPTNHKHAEKRRKYEEQAKARGHTFSPLVFETHGRMHGDIKTLLNTFAANTIGRRGLAVSDMRLNLALMVVRGNAMCARSTISRARRHQDFIRAR